MEHGHLQPHDHHPFHQPHVSGTWRGLPHFGRCDRLQRYGQADWIHIWLTQNGFSQGNLIGDSTSDIFALDGQGAFAGVTHLLLGALVTSMRTTRRWHYGGSDSTPAVQVTIQAEETTLTFSVLTTNPSGNLVPFSNVPYGTPVYFPCPRQWPVRLRSSWVADELLWTLTATGLATIIWIRMAML